MPGQLHEESGRVALHIGTSFQTAWDNVLLPWFETAAPRAFKSRGTVAVITPFRSHAYLLRSRLLARGISLLGVKFLSPAKLRELLLRGSGLNLPLREHLCLLFAIAAEKLTATIDSGQPGDLVAKSVARDPDHFLRIFDGFAAAGWSLSEIGEPVLGEIAGSFEELCHECGFTFLHEADRLALASAEKSEPRFSSLLVMGFDGAHWPLWPLLHAAVKSSAQATIVLNDPRDEARDIDETWVGTWEDVFGGTDPVSEASNDLGQLASTAPARVLPETFFLVGRDATEQARAIVALTARFLCEDNCERIGILFPQKGALSRLVARFLGSAQIAHNDGIAHWGPSVFDDEAWRAWLDLQQNPRLKFLFRFLRALGANIFE